MRQSVMFDDAKGRNFTPFLFHSQKEHGMGIGLYLSNASVEQFGGSVHLIAQSNGASLCRITLPLSHQHG